MNVAGEDRRWRLRSKDVPGRPVTEVREQAQATRREGSGAHALLEQACFGERVAEGLAVEVSEEGVAHRLGTDERPPTVTPRTSSVMVVDDE